MAEHLGVSGQAVGMMVTDGSFTAGCLRPKESVAAVGSRLEGAGATWLSSTTPSEPGYLTTVFWCTHP